MYRALKEGDLHGAAGIGVVFAQASPHEFRVAAVLPGSPAEASGVMPDDVLSEIDGAPTAGMTLGLIETLTSGRAGTAVVLTLNRESFVVPRRFTLERQALPTYPVTSARIGPVLYLRIRYFPEGTAAAVAQALARDHGHKAVLLDVRNNPGGLVAQAAQVAELFLDRGPIITTENHDGEVMERYAASGAHPERVPMVVVMNGGTASAAEIVAAALQDRKRARLVGTHSYGKGSVQSLIEFDDGSALKLTTARYFTALHRGIGDGGLQPDVPAAVAGPEIAVPVAMPAGFASDRQVRAALAALAVK
jgi:carboxyl-terminal processing protease